MSQTQQVIPHKLDSLGAFDLWTASCTPCHSLGAADRHRVRQALFAICFVKHFLTLLNISFLFSISPLHLFVVSSLPTHCSTHQMLWILCFPPKRGMLKHGFKVTGLVWMKRVQFSSLGIQAEISVLQPNP